MFSISGENTDLNLLTSRDTWHTASFNQHTYTGQTVQQVAGWPIPRNRDNTQSIHSLACRHLWSLLLQKLEACT